MQYENKVRGAVFARYESEAALARKLGWTRAKLVSFTLGDREPKLSQVQEMAAALDMDAAVLTEFFLELQSHKCDKKGKRQNA